MIQSTACMRQFKAYADLSGIFLIDRFAADNNKTRHILIIVTDIFCKNRKSVELSCRTACDRSLGFLFCSSLTFLAEAAVFSVLTCFPGRMVFQIMFTLCKCLRMGIDGIGSPPAEAPGSPRSTCCTRYILLSHNIKLIFCQKIINILSQSLLWNSRSEVPHNLPSPKATSSIACPKGFDMVAVDLISENMPAWLHSCMHPPRPEKQRLHP